MFEIGNSLREARLRQGLEFPEIEHATKVRSKYLRALEDEQFDALPAQTYVKGFLRTYAEYLGLDGQLYVDEYNSRYVGLEEESPLRASVRQPAAQERRFAGGAVLAVLAGIAVAHRARDRGVEVRQRLGLDGPAPTAASEAQGETHAQARNGRAHPSRSRSRRPTATARTSSPASPPPGGRQLYAGTLEPGKIQNFRSSQDLAPDRRAGERAGQRERQAARASRHGASADPRGLARRPPALASVAG